MRSSPVVIIYYFIINLLSSEKDEQPGEKYNVYIPHTKLICEIKRRIRVYIIIYIEYRVEWYKACVCVCVKDEGIIVGDLEK